MTRKFRPLQESVDICRKMLNVAQYYGDKSEIKYWTQRIHGYKKIANQKGIPIRDSEVEEPQEDVAQ